MTDTPTPEKIKAFLDDLARISFRHGVMIGASYDGPELQMPDEDFDGYSASKAEPLPGCGVELSSQRWDAPHMRDGYHLSLDLTQLSNHERLEILGNRSPDLARMLREAFMAGVQGSMIYWKFDDLLGEHKDSTWAEVQQGADEYAEKIMGGRPNDQ